MCGWAVDVWAFENSMVTRMYEDPVSFPYHTQLSAAWSLMCSSTGARIMFWSGG
jgi:hypothetical protein